jgi:hypothetical protein
VAGEEPPLSELPFQAQCHPLGRNEKISFQ